MSTDLMLPLTSACHEIEQGCISVLNYEFLNIMFYWVHFLLQASHIISASLRQGHEADTDKRYRNKPYVKMKVAGSDFHCYQVSYQVNGRNV